MRLLVIGASGFIGRHLFSLAQAKGYAIIGTQFSAHDPALISFDLLKDRITDVIPGAFLESNDRLDAVICSAIPKIDLCRSNQKESYSINVTSTIRLMEDLKRLGIQSTFLSSEAVYNGERGYYNESIATCPVNEYGRQKAEVESYIMSRLPKSLILRLSIIVGDDPTEPHLLSQWYRWIRDGKPITCIAGQIFSPTYVKDVARGILEALNKELYGLYNLTNSEFFSREELARQFLAAIMEDAEIVVKPVNEFGFLDKRSMKTYIDGTRFIKATGMRFTSMREVFNSFVSKIKDRKTMVVK